MQASFKRFLAWSGAICLLAPLAMAGGLTKGSVHDIGAVDKCGVCHGPRDQGPGAFERFAGIGGRISSESLVCLACHDGASGPAVHAKSTAGTAMLTVLGGGEHPVSVAVDPLRADMASVDSIEAMGLPLYGKNHRVECPTCHLPHAIDGGAPGLLRRSNVRSALCLSCHQL